MTSPDFQRLDSLCLEVVALFSGEHLEPCAFHRSQSEKWEERLNNNPYFNIRKQTKRSKKITREVRGVFKDWKKAWIAAALANVKKVDSKGNLTPEEWMAYGNATLSAPVFSKKLNQVFIEGELVTAYNEIVSSLKKLHNIKISTVSSSSALPAGEIAWYEDYHLRLAGSLKDSVLSGIKGEITQGYAQGESMQQIADRISEKFRVIDERRAIAIARTETMRASNEGSRLSFIAADIETYDVLPAIDACEICVDVASENPYDVTEQFSLLPVHPSCRCTIVPHGF